MTRSRSIREAAWTVAIMLCGGASALATDLQTVSQRVIAQDLSSIASATTIEGYESSLQSNGSWSDINYADTSATNWSPDTHVTRLLAMAQAYSSSSSSLYDNATLKADILKAYDYWIATNPQSSNWWYNQIGSLQPLGSTMVLMQSSLSSSELTSGESFLGRAVPSSNTGQNRVDLSIVQIDQGIVEASPTIVSSAFSSIGSTIAIIPAAGIQTDNSYQFHGPQLYVGGYGELFAADALNEASIAAGTSYAITSAQEQLMVNYLLDGVQWFVRGQALDLTSSGRGDSRAGISTAGTSYVSAINSALALGTYRQSELQSFLARQKSAQSSGVFDPAQSLSGNRNFFDSDIMVQQRPAYYSSVKVSSTRTSQTESGNGEGLTNLYMSDGVNQIMVTGQEYNNIEPVWNWRRLPGTTVEQDTRSLKPTSDWGVLGTSTFAGGVSDGTYGAEAFNYNRYDVAAKKSWFMFDNEEVALGAAINAPKATYEVDTTINQCLLQSAVTYETTASSTPVTMNTGTVTPAGLKWVIQNGVGYLFASPVSNATIQAISQTGSWQEINSTQSATPVTKNVFTLYIDHGTAVNNASYSYIVVPGMTAASMDAYAAANPIQIIRNDANVQAVRQSSLGVTQAAFYAADSFSIATGQTVAASTPSTVMLEQQPDSLKISASTPAAKQITLQLTLTGVHISSSGSTWLDAMGTGIASLNLPGGSLAGSTVGFTLSSDGNPAPLVSLSSDDGAGAYSYSVSSAVALAANTTFQDDALGTLKFSDPISGAASLTKAGAGQIILIGANTYTGGTTINAGSIKLSNSTGMLPATGAVVINSPGILYTDGSSFSIATLAGSGTISTSYVHAGTDTLTVGSGNINTTFTGTIQGGTGAGSGYQAIALTKTGNGVLTLSGVNTYTGATTISSGAVLAENSAAFGAGAVTIANGGTSTASLQLAGGVTISNPFAGLASEDGSDTPTFENISGSNTISSNLSITKTGGNGVIFQSDAGLLTLNGGLTTTLPSSRIYYFQGAGNGLVNGNITDDASGILQVVKSGSGTWTLNGTNTYAEGTTINAGTLILGPAGSISGSKISVNTGGTFTFGASAGSSLLLRSVPNTFNINTGGTLTIAPPLTHASRQLLVVNSGNLNIAGTTGAWTGTVDLTGNDLDIANGNLAQITDQLRSGNANGSWAGTGIMSSTSADDSTHLTALGVILNGSTYGTSGSLGLFDGTNPAPTDVLVKYTYIGDANLDGQIDGSDYTLIDNGFNNHLTGWQNGDFNYDGKIDGSDYTLLDNAFNMQAGSLASTFDATNTAQIAGSASTVPEPTAGLLIGAAAAHLLRRRRKLLPN
jgi:chondroitin AC lyase